MGIALVGAGHNTIKRKKGEIEHTESDCTTKMSYRKERRGRKRKEADGGDA